MLSTRFGRNFTMDKQTTPLSNDQLMRVAPSIFAAGKHDSRSDRYTWIPTIDVLDGLRKEGFMPFMALQSKSRIEGKSEFTKHMLRLRRPDEITASEANEIILINSHDGTSSYQMLSGVFRFVCQNGMVSGDKVEDIRVPHRGNIVDNVVEAAYSIRDAFEAVTGSMEEMKRLELSPDEAEIFARASMALKYEEGAEPFAARKLLQVRRNEDTKSDIWTRFNVVQENLMTGGQQGRSANGSNITTRPVKAIDGNVKLNRALWILADQMAALKA